MSYANKGAGTSGSISKSGQGRPRVCVEHAPFPKGWGAALNAAGLGHGSLQLQTNLLGRGAAGSQPPQVDGQAARRRHRQPAFGAFTGAAAQLLNGRVVGLPAHQPPDHLDEGVTHRRVAAAVNAAFPAPAIAVVDGRAQAGVTADLATVLEALPPAD